jgi:hypothetical protein
MKRQVAGSAEYLHPTRRSARPPVLVTLSPADPSRICHVGRWVGRSAVFTPHSDHSPSRTIGARPDSWRTAES